MNEQSSLTFVPVSPVAATADPETSHESARRVTRDGTRCDQAERVLRAVRFWPGLTSAELAREYAAKLPHWPAMDRYAFARRLPELADPKNGASIEKGEPRECRVTGRLALTWWPVVPPTPKETP